MTSSLLDICLDTIARSLPYNVAFSCDAVPIADLVHRLYVAYMRHDQRRRLLGSHDPALHFAALRQFATCWQPCVLVLRLPNMSGQPLDELAAFSSSLAHLDLSCAASSSLAGLTGLTSLACLSLRGCQQLQAQPIQQVLQGLPQLSALDLSGLRVVSDSLAPTLAALTQLLVLNLNGTACSDTTVEWLTYGQRLHDWRSSQTAAAGAAGPVTTGGGQPLTEWEQAGLRAAETRPAGQQQGQAGVGVQPERQWPRLRVVQWHLANTRVTAHTAEWLWCCQDLVFLDMRGSGVRASQLVPLRRKFALAAVQGAVLSRSAAVAAAAVSLDMFVCSSPSEHSTTTAAGPLGSADHDLHQWVQQGVVSLVHAKDEAVKAAEAAAAWQATAAAAACTYQGPHPWQGQRQPGGLQGQVQAPWHVAPWQQQPAACPVMHPQAQQQQQQQQQQYYQHYQQQHYQQHQQQQWPANHQHWWP